MPYWDFYLVCWLGITLIILWQKKLIFLEWHWSDECVWKIDNSKDQGTYGFWLAICTVERKGRTFFALMIGKLAVGFFWYL